MEHREDHRGFRTLIHPIRAGCTGNTAVYLMSGNRCANCHVNQQGAGLRNELGWYSMMDESVIKPASVGLGGLYEPLQQTNLAANETFAICF
ncbi:MAG: hypothetical protein IPI29_06455 [Ignavibacteria bacterium]|nr:hypothetical protein [Ignavibacteria bacterium]